MQKSATYKEIRQWMQKEFGYAPETCWIAHCKELNGLPLRNAPNRHGKDRIKPCPEGKRAEIRKAFKHFGML
jgi:hypothetical protein